METQRNAADDEKLERLVIRIRNHVCEAFAILEELERLRLSKAAAKSTEPTDEPDTSLQLATGWMPAGY